MTDLLQNKVEDAIQAHVAGFSAVPLFMLYSPQNVHIGGTEGYEAPQAWLDKCVSTKEVTGQYEPGYSFNTSRAYCALVLMLDDAVGRTVCAWNEAGLGANSLVVVVSDNGGLSGFPGSNTPFMGAKGSLCEGGINNAAFVFGSIIPESVRGSVYGGLIHITDWFPTLLKLASDGSWTGPSNGYAIDGIDVMEALRTGGESPRREIFHNTG